MERSQKYIYNTFHCIFIGIFGVVEMETFIQLINSTLQWAKFGLVSRKTKEQNTVHNNNNNAITTQ